MSAQPRDDTSVFRHATPGCVVCGGALHRAGTGRRRLYCGQACRQRAYRLGDEQRRLRGAEGRGADPPRGHPPAQRRSGPHQEEVTSGQHHALSCRSRGA